jgi:hypothetical protein
MMRPLDKGSCPIDNSGNRISVNDYTLWRKRLIDRIGYYCVYCNMPLSHSLQVEHVVPKNPPSGSAQGDLLGWDNMLLACGPCNNAKGNTPIDFNDYYFPENNNTLLPFQICIHPVHADAAIVQKAEGLELIQQRKAEKTIELLGLANIDMRNNIVDLRWKKRKDADLAVNTAFELYKEIGEVTGNALIAIPHLVQSAKHVGFFGLWFEKFKNEPEVMQAFLNPDIIPGTAQECFDATDGYKPQYRNRNRGIDPI